MNTIRTRISTNSNNALSPRAFFISYEIARLLAIHTTAETTESAPSVVSNPAVYDWAGYGPVNCATAVLLPTRSANCGDWSMNINPANIAAPKNARIRITCS